jgi:hypothetical protein
MTEEESLARAKEYVRAWAEAGAFLEQERRDRVRRVDTAQALEHLDALFDSALWLHRPADASGLVEQQAIFAKARR